MQRGAEGKGLKRTSLAAYATSSETSTGMLNTDSNPCDATLSLACVLPTRQGLGNSTYQFYNCTNGVPVRSITHRYNQKGLDDGIEGLLSVFTSKRYAQSARNSRPRTDGVRHGSRTPACLLYLPSSWIACQRVGKHRAQQGIRSERVSRRTGTTVFKLWIARRKKLLLCISMAILSWFQTCFT